MSVRYRFNFAPNTVECGCSVCGRVFIDTASFDVHRDIRPQGRRGDDAQDGGKCDVSKLTEAEDGRWGNDAAHERVAHMQKLRSAR